MDDLVERLRIGNRLLPLPVLIEAADRIEALQAEVARLTGLLKPQWFYTDGYDQEGCRFSPEEVIEYYDLKPGKQVVSVDCAAPLPSLWYVVHILTDDEMETLETDDRELITEYPSEEAARQALKGTDNAE